MQFILWCGMGDTENKPVWEEGAEVAERSQVKPPRMFKVLLHNDDYTTMEFVVHVLVTFFSKSATEAEQIMWHVHHKGVGVAGVYTRDVAQTKVARVHEEAKKKNMPLKCSLEPA